MAKSPLPSIEELNQSFRYDAEAGRLFWRDDRPKPSPHGKYGTGEAFLQRLPSGYLQGAFGGNGRKLYAHRVAWALHYGQWPQDEIDHINGDPADNRIANLRQASRTQNAANRGAKGGASKFRGVIASISKVNPWCAQIRHGKKTIHLGQFASEDDAARAYDSAAKELHGEFARLNFTD